LAHTFTNKAILLAFFALFAGFSVAAPTLGSVSDSPDPLTAGAAITFTASASTPDGLPFKLIVCKTGNDSSCTKWCEDADLNSSATASECTYTTSAADIGAKDYNALVCDTNSPAQCSGIQAGTFTVNAAADTTPPAAGVKDINGDTSAPYWARTDQPVNLVLNIGESSGECKWSDANWGASAYADVGNACTTSGNEAACGLGAKSQTTGTDINVFYNCKDSSGNATGGILATYGVDFTAPTGSISASVSENNATATYSGSDAHSGLQKYEIGLDGGSYTDKGTATTHSFSGLGNGDHNFTVRITDNAGNSTTFTDTKNVNFSSSAVGTLDINSATHPQNDWKSNSGPEFAWTSASNASKYRYALSTSSDTVPDSNNETTERAKSYSGIGDGERWFHVRGCNSSNECGTTSHYRIRIDTTAPEPVSNISGFSQSNGSIYITWGAPTDTSGIKEYIVYRSIFEKVGSRDFVPSDTGVKAFTGIAATNFTDRNGLELGQVYYYRIRAVDNALNQGSMSSVQKIQNSGSSCQLEISSNVPQYTKGGTLNIQITIAGGQIANTTLRIKTPGKDYIKLLESQKGTSITKAIDVPADSGDGIVELEGKDERGNACKKQFGFTVDSEKPSVEISAPQEGTSLKGNVKVTAKVTDAFSGVDTVSLLVDEKSAGTLQKNGDNYEITWNSNSISAGRHTLAAVAKDKAGNEGRAEIEINAGNSEDGIFLRKEYSYVESNVPSQLKAAGLKDAYIKRAQQLIEENSPTRSLVITKTASGLKADIVIRVKNSGSTKSLQAIEVIPKGVIGNARDITSSESFVVVQADPIIRFDLGEVETGEEMSISYNVGTGLADWQANLIAEAFDSYEAPPVILEGDAKDAIEASQTSDLIFWIFIAAVAIIVLILAVAVVGGGAFILHRHIKTRDSGFGNVKDKDKPLRHVETVPARPPRTKREPKSKGKFAFGKEDSGDKPQ